MPAIQISIKCRAVFEYPSFSPGLCTSTPGLTLTDTRTDDLMASFALCLDGNTPFTIMDQLWRAGVRPSEDVADRWGPMAKLLEASDDRPTVEEATNALVAALRILTQKGNAPCE
jgi:hypothetical protein